MKKIVFYLTGVLIFSLAFSACSKDDNNDDDDSGNNNTSSYVSFTMEGTDYTLNNVTPVVVAESYIQLTATGEDDNVQLQIHVDSSAEMTYGATDVVFSIGEYQVDSSLSANYDAEISLIFEETSSSLEGTFNGTFVKIMTADPPSKEVTNGVIFVKSEDIVRY